MNPPAADPTAEPAKAIPHAAPEPILPALLMKFSSVWLGRFGLRVGLGYAVSESVFHNNFGYI
jgi:hypothetical protein